MPTVQDYFADVENLPPAPQILPQLLRLLSDVDTDTGRITLWEQVTRERAAWSTDHAGHLLAKWQFSPAITAAVWHHHHPSAAAPHEQATACVCLANAIAHTIDQPNDLSEVIQIPARDDALHLVKLDPERLAYYLAQTRENFDFINAMCRLNN